MLAAIDARQRLAAHAGEYLAGLAFHRHHLRHQQAGRIGAVDAGRHQPVAGLDLGIRRQESQLGQTAGAGAEHDAAQSAALHLHRHRVILVRHQRDLGHVRKHPRHLADDAELVDDRLAGAHTGALALVDEHLLREGIAPGIHHFGGDRRALKALVDLQQRTQLCVLLRDERIALGRRRLPEQLLLERRILEGKRTLGREVAADIRERLAGHLRRALDRIQHDGDGLADVLEIAEAGVGEQGDQRDQSEERESRQRRRAAMEERRRVNRDVTHALTVKGAAAAECLHALTYPTAGSDAPPGLA